MINDNISFGLSSMVEPPNQKEKEVALHLSDAFPKEEEKVKYHETDISSLIYKEDELVSMNNDMIQKSEGDGNLLIKPIEYPPNWHPNPMVRNPQQFKFNQWDYGSSNRPIYGYNPGNTPNPYLNMNYAPPKPSYSLSDLYANMNLDVFREGYHNMSDSLDQAQSHPLLEKSNVVDFSNPDSVLKSQSPYGYGSGFNNPNLNRDNGVNPYEYNPTSSITNSWWGGNNNGWYNGWNSWYNFDARRFYDITDFDLEKGYAIKAKIIRGGDENNEIEKVKKEKKQISVSVIREKKKEEVKVEEKQEDEELDPSSIVVPQQHPLVFTDKDDKKLTELCEKLSVYNSAMAYVLYNVPCIKDCTQEMFKYFLEVGQEKLEEYIKDEKDHPELDYRLPYRYRQDPPLMRSPNGTMVHNLFKVEFVPSKKYDDKGNRIYDFDRGHEITEKEMDLFRSRAYTELSHKVQGKIVKWIEDYNKEKRYYDFSKYNNNININENYNHYDPISVRCHQMKVQEYEVNSLRAFYRMARGKSITDDEFDKWWNGDTLEKNIIEQNPSYQRRMQIINQQNQIENYNVINTIPADVKTKNYMQSQANALASLTDNVFEQNKGKGLNGVLEGFGYMENKYIQMRIDKQREEDYNAVNNKFSYKKSLISFGNRTPSYGFNNNFKPGAIFGNADPKYGFPTNYIDLTNTDGYNEKKFQFMNYCENSCGSSPMRTVYK